MITGSSKLPALIALGAIFLWALATTGCMKWQAKRALPDLAESGAHGVDVSRRGRLLRYEVISALPGTDDASGCAKLGKRINVDRFEVVDCSGSSPDGLMPLGNALDKLADSLGRFFPSVGVKAVQVVLVPAGWKYLESNRHTSLPDEIVFSIGFRWKADERSVRSLVRSLTHEYAHIAAGAGTPTARQQNEYLASLAESCIEYEVLGNTRGYASEGELAVAEGGGLSRSMSLSMEMTVRAYEKVRSFSQNGPYITPTNGGDAFSEYCSHTFHKADASVE